MRGKYVVNKSVKAQHEKAMQISYQNFLILIFALSRLVK